MARPGRADGRASSGRCGRFFQACAADQTACAGFGGSDPWDAYDQLVDQANAHPIPAPTLVRPAAGRRRRHQLRRANELYAKEFWGELGRGARRGEAGDGSFIRDLVDGSYGRNDDGTFGNGLDLYFTIGASEQRYPRDVDFYLDRGDEAWGTFHHDYWNNGYPELNYGLWPSHDKDAFAGPFKLPHSAPTPLVVATTYDPATPYNGALRLVHDLGNARLITMRGDGHTAYGGESACIDAAVEAYVNTLALPAEGTACTQDTPFEPLRGAREGEALASPRRRSPRRRRPRAADLG